eukprot:TRINITY_DN8798_c0_g1_i1.p1 TRINITY_DN8798_c0_g1~~TRINITY_DN8798_c0_g1_i1.p1  ORF type:complete len:280 (+),score=20.17 TRINITY_DN8798_c0_g1_i1:543-1382(+)
MECIIKASDLKLEKFTLGDTATINRPCNQQIRTSTPLHWCLWVVNLLPISTVETTIQLSLSMTNRCMVADMQKVAPFFGASSNRKSPGLISTVLPGTSIRRYYAAHSGAIVVNELGEYFARSGSAVRKSQFCLSTEVTYSMPWVKANDGVGLQGDVDSVYCAYSVCALQSKSTGEIYICSDEVVTVDGVGTTALSPRLISSALNSGCSAGTSRNKVAKSYYALAFYGTCPGVMGIASNGAGSVCSSTEPTFQLSSVASLPGVYEAVDGNGHLLAALKKF